MARPDSVGGESYPVQLRLEYIDERQVLLICLDSLRVDTTTAAAVAAAAGELAQQALAVDLMAALSKRGLSLGPLLQLYLATLRCSKCQNRCWHHPVLMTNQGSPFPPPQQNSGRCSWHMFCQETGCALGCTPASYSVQAAPKVRGAGAAGFSAAWPGLRVCTRGGRLL